MITINENDFLDVVGISSQRTNDTNDNVLDITPEIREIAGVKASQKTYNKFCKEDSKQGFSEANKLLEKGFMPNISVSDEDEINSLRKGYVAKFPNRLLSVKQAYKFRLAMPKNIMVKNGKKIVLGLNPSQEFNLQRIYLTQVKVGKSLLDMKDKKLDVAKENNKIIHLAKNLTMDFRKA